MAEQKIFAGPRIRRIRNQKRMTQTAMAEGLGISPSYLNLIERNQRPLTVQLILKLASVYRVDPHELQAEARGSAAALKEVFSDPLLAGELPGDQEILELAEAAPNASAAVIKLFRAYREQAERLTDLSQLLAREGLRDGAVVHSPAFRRGARGVRAAAEPFWRHRGRGGSVCRGPRSRRRPPGRAEGLAEA